MRLWALGLGKFACSFRLDLGKEANYLVAIF